MTATIKPSWIGRARHQLTRYLKEEASSATAATIQYKNPDELYFDESRDRVALEAPYPVLPSLALPPGHAYAASRPIRHSNNDGNGNHQPIVVYRDKKDPTCLRAYVNSCRHRGSPLLREKAATGGGVFETTPLKAPLLTCPYHAWTYDAATGQLKRIPGHKKAFDLLNQQDFGLTPIPCKEQAGIVWIGGHGDDGYDDDAILTKQQNSTENHESNNKNRSLEWSIDGLSLELEPFLYDPSSFSSSMPPPDNNVYKVLGYREWTIQANWQLAIETALESYHIKSLHNSTLNIVAHPTWSMYTQQVDEPLLRNAIMTIALRSFQPQEQQDDDNHHVNNQFLEEDDIRSFLEQTTTTCLLFPSTLVSLVKRCFIINTVEPINNASCKIRSWAVPHRFSSEKGANEEDDHLAKRDYDSIIVGVEEDWDCVEQIQKGLNAAASNYSSNYSSSSTNSFVFGGYEGNNVWFLQNVGDAAESIKSKRKRSK